MIGPIDPIRAPMDSVAVPAINADMRASASGHTATPQASGAQQGGPPPTAEPILCGHCGRTASNGISCQGMCVADSGY
jgi:hypothetical protein